MSTAKASPLSALSRRLRRWQDVTDYTNERAAEFLGIPLRTYTNILYAEHMPRSLAMSLLNRLLDQEETRLKLPTLE